MKTFLRRFVSAGIATLLLTSVAPASALGAAMSTINSVSLADADNVYMAGKLNDGTGFIGRTADGGMNWTNRVAGTDIRAVSARDLTTAWAANWFSNSAFITSNGGGAWQAKTVAAEGSAALDFRDIVALDGGAAVAVGQNSYRPDIPGEIASIWRTDDAGDTWLPIFEGPAPRYFDPYGNPDSVLAWLSSADFAADRTTGWAVGTEMKRNPNGSATLDRILIYNTTTAGSTWTTQTVSGVWYANAVTAASPTAAWFGGAYRHVARTTNGGSSWADVSPTSTEVGSAFDVQALYAWDENSCVAVGSGGKIAKSTDGGNTWALKASGTTQELRSVAFVGSTGYAAGGNRIGGTPMLLKSTDAGETWTRVTFDPVAVADSYAAAEDTQLVKNAAAGVLANDTDPSGETLTAVKVSDPSHGTLVLNADGSFTYSPAANYHGSDVFTYRAYDGTTYSNTVTVSLNVTSVNDVPVAVADSYTALRSTALVIAGPGVLANDTDADGEALTAAKQSNPAHGTVSLSANGSFTYEPTDNYVGPDSFTYRANDGTANSNTVTVTLNVADSNTAPVAANDTHATAEDTPLVLDAVSGVLANDTDAEDDTLSAIKLGDPSHGTLALSLDGSLVYTPDANYHGPDSFTYKANDGRDDSNIATVSLTVSAVNDAPVAAAESYTTAEDTALTKNAAAGVLANDSDVEGSALSAAIVEHPSHGALALSGDGSFLYTPASDYSGPDAFTYRAFDGTDYSSPVVVSLTITAVNDAPEAEVDSYVTDEDASLAVPAMGVLANDIDAEGDVLSAVKTSDPSHGALTLGADGSFVYTPAPNYYGPDSFTYRTSDGSAYSDVVTVSIEVAPVDEPPPVWKPVYRFYNVKTGVHFYTASEAEKASVIANLSHIFKYEGVSYQVNTANPTNRDPLYRFYNKKKGVHFYTASAAEKDSVIQNLSATYVYEGIGYNVSTLPTSMPVYRFYNMKQGVHFYTASAAEKNSVIANLSHIYKYEGTGYYVGQ